MRITSLWITAPLLLAIAATGCAKKSTLAPTAFGARPSSSGSQVAGKSGPSAVQQAGARISDAMTIKPTVVKPADAVSLSDMPTSVNYEVYLASARLAEQSGNFAAAEQQYRKALEVAPKNLTIQVGYARLQDRQGKFEEAIKIYHQAAQTHPNSQLVFNDLGLCLARKGDLPGATSALQRAISLDPKNARYRNNLAAVLVTQNRQEEAFRELAAVHAPAAAHYNFAYLLLRSGDEASARQHLQQAVAADSSLQPARDLLATLGGPSTSAPVSVAAHTEPPRRTPPVEDRPLSQPETTIQGGPVLTPPKQPDFTPPARYERNGEPLLRRTPPTAAHDSAPRFPVSLAIPQVENTTEDSESGEVVYPEIRLPRSLQQPEAKLTTHVE